MVSERTEINIGTPCTTDNEAEALKEQGNEAYRWVERREQDTALAYGVQGSSPILNGLECDMSGNVGSGLRPTAGSLVSLCFPLPYSTRFDFSLGLCNHPLLLKRLSDLEAITDQEMIDNKGHEVAFGNFG